MNHRAVDKLLLLNPKQRKSRGTKKKEKKIPNILLKEGEIEKLKESCSRLNSDKIKYKEENFRLERVILDKEEELINSREVIDKKKKELSANFEEISPLKQELAHYKIDFLCLNFYINKLKSNLSREMINELLTEKKENSDKIQI